MFMGATTTVHRLLVCGFWFVAHSQENTGKGGNEHMTRGLQRPVSVALWGYTLVGDQTLTAMLLPMELQPDGNQLLHMCRCLLSSDCRWPLPWFTGVIIRRPAHADPDLRGSVSRHGHTHLSPLPHAGCPGSPAAQVHGVRYTGSKLQGK